MPGHYEYLCPHTPPLDYGHHSVIIMGAGPTGLFLGLKLAQQGIDVLVLEAEKEIATYPRDCLYDSISQWNFLCAD
jgi:cation diffusion facilitator CzcD-associated flavoprotein CzcO